MNFKKIFFVYVKNLSLVFTLLILIFFSISINGCESRERVIKIGNQCVLSGEYKSFGEEQTLSIELAASRLSPVRIGGFDYDIKIITKDDEGNPEKAFLVAQEMVDDGVSAVIGSTFDGTTESSLTVYEEYGIPLVSPFAQKTEVNDARNIFFRMIISNKQKIENIAKFIGEKIKPRKLILINNREEYSINLVNYLKEVLSSEYGIETGNTMSLNIGEEDMGVIVDNLIIEGPDTIFICCSYEESAAVMTASREAGLQSRFITETLGMDDNIFNLTEANNLEGLIAIIPDPPSLARYSQDSKAVNFWREFNNYLTQADHPDISIEGPGQYSPYCYDSVFVIIEAMKRANSILPGDYVDELKAISYDGITGRIEFDEKGNRLNPESTIFIVKDGAWIRYQ
jgi:branched-chain amino acid transport system substrate-binding protein